MIEISDAMAAFNAILELAKTAVSARDSAKIEEALTDMKVKYLAAMESSLKLHGEIATLKGRLMVSKQLLLDTQAELDELKKSLAERENYLLYEIDSGIFCYRYEPVTDQKKTALHYLCQPCWDQGKKSILRKFTDTRFTCPERPDHVLVLVAPPAD